MDSKPIAVYKPSKNFTYYFVIIVSLGAMVLGCFLFSNSVKKTYPGLLDIIGAGILILFGIYAAYVYLNRRIIYVFNEDYIFKSGFTQNKVTVLKKDILSWSEIGKVNKYSTWNELTIFTAAKKYRFEDVQYRFGDYHDFKKDLKKHVIRNADFEKKEEFRFIKNFSIGFLLLGLIFILTSVNFFLKINEPFNSANYTKIKQVVTSKIKIKKGSKGAKSIHLTFKDYPEFSFDINGDAYRTMYTDDFIQTVKTRDTLYISVLNEDFEKKLAKTKPLSFFDKAINYYNIDLFGIADKREVFLTTTDCAKERKSRRNSNAWTFGVIGFLFFGLALFAFFKKNGIVEMYTKKR